MPITQNPPLPSEVALARIIVSKAKEDLRNLKVKIAELKLQEQQLQNHLHDHERIVFSINRLPTELLSLIFLLAIPSLPLQHNPPPATVQSPWLVSQVCKLWREIALNSQLLWSFPIVFPTTQSPTQLKLHLERAGNTGLHPFLTGSPRGRYFPRLLASVMEYSPQWVTLILSFDWTPLQDRLAALKGHVGQLKELQIDGIWGEESHVALGEGQRLTAFAVTPKLRTVKVRNVCEPAVSLLLPWHQLTEYRALGTTHEHLSVLKLCPNLVTLDLSFPTMATIVKDSPIQAVLPHLVHLHIGDAEFLRVLCLPVLEEIIIQRTDPAGNALLPLLDLIRRDRPPLHDISLVHSVLVTPTLISILRESPTITALRIHVRREDTAVVDDLLGRLTLKPDLNHTSMAAPCLAPNLTELEFSGRGTFDQARFVSMLESRWRGCGCAQIRRVVVRPTKKAALTSETMQRLRASSKEGLYVSVKAFSFFTDDVVEPS
ncbi:hypothetical protein B0H16DRAFT_1883890 [Mycena metata]|uniref:F-box domain-containing protein n=1 Tax=Mycena metata TaxID=1033252 RepID=A0AAD7NIW6_9AGAR|nr:hypothetical protein B0H16DRAFT_1883890 [Mycena metata]